MWAEWPAGALQTVVVAIPAPSHWGLSCAGQGESGGAECPRDVCLHKGLWARSWRPGGQSQPFRRALWGHRLPRSLRFLVWTMQVHRAVQAPMVRQAPEDTCPCPNE